MAANAGFMNPGEGETVFTVSTSPIKFGPGALRELGDDAASLGMKRVALFVDPHVRGAPCGELAVASLRSAGLDPVAYETGARNAGTARSSRASMPGLNCRGKPRRPRPWRR